MYIDFILTTYVTITNPASHEESINNALNDIFLFLP